ncbi:nucleotide pyrophosphohydrolase [Clostridiales bacterium PH28_bin88]|nr:nucleotide pyrophosphohydrolase [Clostridiales bacterium PH28_bin88]
MGRFLTVTGLGPGDPALIPAITWQSLRLASRVFLRTERHPVVPELVRKGISFEAMDGYYEEAGSFEEVYRRIVARLMSAAGERRGEVVYCVPGHPMVAETTVEWILAQAPEAGILVEVVPAMSCLDAVYSALRLDPAKGLVILDALELRPEQLVPGLGCLVTQFYDRRVASEVKLSLMERYPDEHPVTVVRAAGVPGEQRVEEMPLYRVDRLEWVDYLTTLYVPPCRENADESRLGRLGGQAGYPLDPLVQLMSTLRGDRGCPWDKQQTHQSLKRYLVEEAYEVLDAIDSANMHNLCEELGDLLLQVVFHAQLARESGAFDMNDVVQGITEKMIRRHPHVFGEVEAETPSEVKANWDQIKAAEKEEAGQKSAMDIPRALPALMRAEKVQQAAARVGFDWPEVSGAWEKVGEELRELKASVENGDAGTVREEMGDVLFAVVNVARFLGIHAEEALGRSVEKFIRRFRHIETRAQEQGRNLAEMTLEEMDIFWEEAKKSP